MKPFNDTYVMYQLLEFIDESSIICLCKASKKLNEICKKYIEMEDERRFEINIIENKNNELLQEYCINNDLMKIRKFNKMNLYWDWGLYGACEGGHMDIVRFLIEKGADQWDWGLSYACRGGHMEIVKLMIEKGCKWLNGGLSNACKHGHMNIVKFLIEKGASVCGYGYGCGRSLKEHLKK